MYNLIWADNLLRGPRQIITFYHTIMSYARQQRKYTTKINYQTPHSEERNGKWKSTHSKGLLHQKKKKRKLNSENFFLLFFTY